ncbi:GerAB/ArcD/ProY family transporter [Clostridium tepidum]|jgi:spore germination protein (amino acid permease)|uniref:Spore gernimation protein n=1 Tax=Clostridium tepidum TaxID=1962263 RepID=A0A1S9I3Z3_9CLOT|nr:endospore germination permease [Clostridium tepidum]MCR1935613.1 spore germination protein [Clostridium tepidum]MDU6877057.1 endospore germination permease [Clostridium botulinum]OOO62928.1 spore gernimation protein [Clostridium tepidum]OOO65023.1 spore gernimation protein [Clostridium tepidum]
MVRDDNFVTSYSLFATIITTVIGISVFSYASELSNAVGNDGWIVVLLSALISFALIYIMYLIIKINNYNEFYQIVNYNFGTVLGKLIALSFVVYNIVYISNGLRFFVEEMKVYLLEQTPTEFLIIVSVLVTGYLIRGEVDTLVKFNEVAFWVSFIPVIFVLMFAFYQGDFTNLLPVLQAKPANYINAIWSTINRFKGIEIIFLLLPFMKKKNKTPKVLVSSLFFVGVFYIFIVILSITMFSTEQVKIMLWPGITMIKSIEIPGTFVERWEGIIMAIWVIFFFTTFVNSYYFSADILKDVLNIEDVKISSLIIVPFIYIIALYPQNVAEVIDLEKNLMPIMFIINIVIIPIVLYFISKFRLKRRSKKY